MGSRRVRLWAAAVLFLLGGSAWLYGYAHQLDQRAHAQRQAETIRYWDALLAAHYEVYGAWDKLEPLLERHREPRARAEGPGAPLWVRDADGRIVFDAAISGSETLPARITPILHEGRIVGNFAVADTEPPASMRAILFAVAYFLIGAALLYGLLRGVRRNDGALQAALRDKEAALEGARLRIGKLERVRSTMVADVAHELRNPLSTIRAMSEHALARNQEMAGERVAVLHGEIVRMSKLVNDLNQLALAESGHLQLNKSWFSLAELLQSTMDTLQPAAEERHLDLGLQVASASSRVYADRMRIQQVVINLLANALHHSRSRIQATVRDGDGATLWIEIADDGVGIEEEELPYVFDRFYRSNPGSGGLGLGLAIVKEFVQAHGGRVEVHSRWEEGTTFTVCLPAMQD